MNWGIFSEWISTPVTWEVENVWGNGETAHAVWRCYSNAFDIVLQRKLTSGSFICHDKKTSGRNDFLRIIAFSFQYN